MISFIIEPLNRFFRHTFYSYKALFNWLDPEVYILVKIIGPIFQVLFFGIVQHYANSTSDITIYIISAHREILWRKIYIRNIQR